MKRLPPLSTYSSPSRRAWVRIAAESEPEPGSVERVRRQPLAAREARAGSAAFCSSVPASLSPSDPSSCTAMMRPLVAQTFESSSIATSAISAPVPVPPCSSSNRSPKQVVARGSSSTDVPRELGRLVDLRGPRRDRARARGRARGRESHAVRRSAGRSARPESTSSPGTRSRSRSRSCRGTRTRAPDRPPAATQATISRPLRSWPG